MEDNGFIDIGGVRLEVRRWAGSAPPILLLHEALGSVSLWRDFPARLAYATGRAVIAWSRQGHGASDGFARKRAPDYLDREAALLPAILDRLDVPQAHLFGHSDGASIALLAAALFPNRVLKLVLEAPHVNVEQKAVEAVGLVGRAYETTDLRSKLQRHHTESDPVFWAWHDIWVSPQFRTWTIEAVLAGIAAPVLVVQGRDDQYFSLDQVDIVVRSVAGAEPLVLDHCGHSPHRDKPDAVLAATTAFLARRAGRGTALR